ncbi:MAG: MBL-fold metallo-hydrolase superfamily [uncultured Sphingomonadaceae bacterium]|uniref:MBL-fold metallo-hydrolase superfamily n=1 Tax=uncultured Sphingomonadaceae bacterium TaxID=169976 RepID=A0A6J4T0N1_9SPHN|nr:MAG: MBL-fold metallo-hydrolase superfamily [uncultured Sphingomonadaceae bacterium]
MKKLLAAATAFLALSGMQAPPAANPAPLSMTRLDCGTFLIKDFGAFFSDTFAYKPGQAKTITSSCYLIRHGARYMLWDTGVPAAMAEKPAENAAQRISLGRTVLDQLKQLGVRPDQIEIIGISHHHFDHTGQAAAFPSAKLVIGKGDFDFLKNAAAPAGGAASPIQHWLSGGGKVVEATGDVDIFHNGRVIMLDTPGHTPGHNALLVKLASGNVLLTGDLYHFTEQVAIKGVPPFNHDRADTLASMDRFDRIAKNLNAKVIIQHEPTDIGKLPAFPKAAQ